MLINGKEIAEEILKDVKKEVEVLSFQPLFCDISVGSDPVSLSYIKIKGRVAKRNGFAFEHISLPEDIKESELISVIKETNQKKNICGLIVQLPLPANFNQQAVLDAVDPKIDVDCMGTENSSLFYSGYSRFIPPTAAAILHVIESLSLDLKSMNLLVIGQGVLVGKPLTFLLKKLGLQINTLTQHSSRKEEIIKHADVLISATGQPGLINGAMIKSGAVVIDAGASEIDGSIFGDVDTDSVLEKSRFLSPVPGGVGPITVAFLLKNILSVAVSK
jgi:methylenetetrahydrofolate dehydrogenase (NADP+)/methenyltetrahydrofolate cyclohydrolase